MNNKLQVEFEGAVLRLVLNDNATRNSLSLEMLICIQAQLEAAEADSSVKVIVFSSSGKAFSSGHNLTEMTAHRADLDGGKTFFDTLFCKCSDVMCAIATHRCAVIAEVDGLASAAGSQLVSACDLAYASSRASFCTPGVNIGLFCSTPMVHLSRAVSSKHAMEMLLTGRTYNSDFALRIGLINEIVEQNKLRSHVMDIANLLATKSPQAIRIGKKLCHEQRDLPLSEAYALASARMADNVLENDAIEGIGALLGKRSPVWRQ
jgi:enoyl-CoA hydratase/carnithine racemase